MLVRIRNREDRDQISSSGNFIMFAIRIPVIGMQLQEEWKTEQILFNWLRQKPADLDQQCF